MTGKNEGFGPSVAVAGPDHQTYRGETCRGNPQALGDCTGRTVGMGRVILTFLARYAEVSKRPTEGEIGGDLRIGQAPVDLDGGDARRRRASAPARKARTPLCSRS
jgi:hypothetical protein